MEPEQIATDTAPCKYARVRKEDNEWHVTLGYGCLPFNRLTTFTYMGDYFLPVVWETEFLSEDEYEDVSFLVNQTTLRTPFTTPFYRADENHAVYFVRSDDYEQLMCVTSYWGDADAVAYALNQTFPGGDMAAYRKQRQHEAEQQSQQVIAKILAARAKEH